MNLDPKKTNKWLIITKGVFESIDCPVELSVQIVTGAFKRRART